MELIDIEKSEGEDFAEVVCPSTESVEVQIEWIYHTALPTSGLGEEMLFCGLSS